MYVQALWSHLDSKDQRASKGLPEEDLSLGLLGSSEEESLKEDRSPEGGGAYCA